MDMTPDDVEFMMKGGFREWFKARTSGYNAPLVFSAIHNYIYKLVLGIGKMTITFLLLSKVYEKIGIEKFGILLLSAYVASQYLSGVGNKGK